ncbi:DUF58 domain-containing protein [Paenibacillus nasutitermitis]|uniref:DUF58 domain-containing protein n=1 Tax=Paenibacillus nasutitermitis TaxID=1652958 RepID=A0A917E058_9BACL|nr:DUF58 domain-containing protein [Paenibacillus nasutitermitis]GGD87868.1 hypothetical protein GCM10010911_52920 [Paenibacillus nasutitermitis]
MNRAGAGSGVPDEAGVWDIQPGESGLGSGSQRNVKRPPEARNGDEHHAVKPGARPVARVMLLMLPLLCLLALQSRSSSAEWLLVCVMGAVAVWCLILPYAAIGRITAVRHIQEDGPLVDGGAIQIKLTVNTSKPLPLMWITVSEELLNISGVNKSDSQTSVKRRIMEIPWFRRSHTFTYSISGLQRGEWKFLPVQISAGDLLGVNVRSFTLPVQGGVKVKAEAPQGEKIGSMPVSLEGRMANQHRPADSAGKTGSAVRARSGSGAVSRGYIPGDPLWRIDWRAMARGLGMQTRLDENDVPSGLIVILDGCAGAYAGDGRLFDANCGRASLAMRHAVYEGNSVTLLFTGQDTVAIHVPAQNRKRLQAAEEQLLGMRPDGRKPLAGQLAGIMSKVPRGSGVVCITAADRSKSLNGSAAPANRGAKLADRTAAARAYGRRGKAAESGTAGPGGSATDNGEETSWAAYAARLAAARRGRLTVLLASATSIAPDHELQQQAKLIQSGCRAVLLPLPPEYRKLPEIREGGIDDAGTRI